MTKTSLKPPELGSVIYLVLLTVVPREVCKPFLITFTALIGHRMWSTVILVTGLQKHNVYKLEAQI